MSSMSSVADRRRKFEEMWPTVVEELGKLTALPEGLAEQPTIAYHYVRAACEMHREAANALARRDFDTALQDTEAIEDFLGQEIPSDMTEADKETAAAIMSFVVEALGYPRD